MRGEQREEVLSLGEGILGWGRFLQGPGRVDVPVQQCQLEPGEVETCQLLCWEGCALLLCLKRAESALCQASAILLASVSQS